MIFAQVGPTAAGAPSTTSPLSIINVQLPVGALPWPILAILLIGFFASCFYAIRKIGSVKSFLGEPPFPTHAAVVVAGILAFLGVAIVAVCRAALGMLWPDGYGEIIALVGGALGIAGAWGVGKRATSSELAEAKGRGAAAVAAATASASPLSVTGSDVSINNAPQPARPVPAAPPPPFKPIEFGGAPAPAASSADRLEPDA